MPTEQAIFALKRLGDSGASSAQVAALFACYWNEIEIVLQPLVGNVSVATLHQRCLFTTGQQFSWLGGAFKGVHAPVDLIGMISLISQQTPVDAALATGLFLDNFHNKIVGLLGVPLTSRLLDSIWIKFSGVPTAADKPS